MKYRVKSIKIIVQVIIDLHLCLSILIAKICHRQMIKNCYKFDNFYRIQVSDGSFYDYQVGECQIWVESLVVESLALHSINIHFRSTAAIKY